MYDPLRVQLLTLSLDSQAVLALLGVLLAGLVARDAARGLGTSPAGMWDAVFDVTSWALLAARLAWVVAHPQEYLVSPRQLFALADGGYSFAVGALAVAWLLRRARGRLGIGAGAFALVAGPSVAAALLLDRAGCALTACGVGQPTAVPWALIRSGAAVHPVALYGLAVWGVLLVVLRSAALRRRPELVWPTLLAALVVERAAAWGLGRDSPEGLLGAMALLGAAALRRDGAGRDEAVGRSASPG